MGVNGRENGGSDWYFIITQAAAGSIWNTLKGLALGSERFKDEIEAALHRKVRPGKAGRPRNARLIS
ncbi:MAG TPA: hypothetical protein VE735_03005 [Gammaproteobacteria bacterium]|jgi:hypothetical protein|nr:hypothetical protein [Gammaproteobacteria bacterium]